MADESKINTPDNEAVIQKFVEVARFTFPADAQTLMALLRSEGIDCYLRNEISAQVMAGYGDIDARVEIAEEDVPRALEVMKAGGYEIPNEDETVEEIRKAHGWFSKIPLIGRLAFEKQLIIILIVVAVFLALIIFFGSLISSKPI